MVDVVKNLERVKRSIEEVYDHYHIVPPSTLPKLIVVSKTQNKEKIIPLLEAGHRAFGENRVQEVQEKWPELKKAYPDVQLHFIGHLQSNKLQDVLPLCDVIHTVDRPKLAHKLSDALKTSEKTPTLYIQVNTGEEPQKSGILPQDADAFIELCIKELELPIKGLMCIPPIEDEPALHFGLLKKIAMQHGLTELSMGMSADYEIAAAMGATCVRVGSLIFGPREA